MNLRLLKIFFLLIPVVVWSQQNRYELNTLEFVGNKFISSASLASTIYSKQSPGWISQFVNKFTPIGGKAIYFDSLLIRSDLEVLKIFYRSKGFFKTKISSKFELDEKAKEAKLTYLIDEGTPVYFHSMTISGCELVAQEFQAVIWENTRVDTTHIYEDAIVEEKKNFTLTFLRDNGYMQASVEKPRVVIDTISKNTADIEIRYNTGKRYKIANLFTTRTGRGFDQVEDDLIKDLVGLKIGNWYSNSDIQRAQVRLYRTNLFESLLINSVVSDTVGNTVPLNINATVGLMNDLSPELIMNNEDNWFNLGAGVNYSRKNFLGGARKFTVGTSLVAQKISQFIKNLSFSDSSFYGYADARISLEQPFLFGLPITAKLESYYTLQRRLSEGYNAKLFGSRFSFDFELSPNVYLNSLSTYLNIERTEYTYKEDYLVGLARTFFSKNIDALPPGYPGDLDHFLDSLSVYFVDIALGSKKSASTNVILGTSLGANKTNDFLFPTKGYSLSLLLEDANSLAYIVSKLSGTVFSHPLSIKSVAPATWYPNVYNTKADAFGLKLKTGQIFTYHGDKINIPMSQRLYSGGSNSVRGWGTRELVPEKQLFSFNDLSREDLENLFLRGAAIGGYFLFEGSVETRHKFMGSFGATLFVDYGNTWNNYSEFRFDQIAVAVGFGFRFYSEFIPFRVDFGLKAYDPANKRSMFTKKFYKEVLQIHIGIGEAF
ncbi:MAG: BamA/TamA family outer membrane protein [Ignavibacteria bacterium]|nr:BamA/TamA family outer membrane protein [Ignavibacteria bacterium]